MVVTMLSRGVLLLLLLVPSAAFATLARGTSRRAPFRRGRGRLLSGGVCGTRSSRTSSSSSSSSISSGGSSSRLAAAAQLIDGKAIAAEVRQEVARAVDALPSPPGLAVILVGDRPDSRAYVRMKKKACAAAGIADYGVDLPVDVSQAELLGHVRAFNEDDRVHGILVQLPLPPHIDERAVIEAVAVAKDVDGLHPLSFAALAATDTHATAAAAAAALAATAPATAADAAATTVPAAPDTASTAGGSPSSAPSAPPPLPHRPGTSSRDGYSIACTALGCVELLDRSGVAIAGKRAVVVGRSNMVGVPLAMLLMRRDATVTIVHSRTADAAAVVREADIVCVAAGRPEMVRGDWIKPGAVVIDVGINPAPEEKREAGGQQTAGDAAAAAGREGAGAAGEKKLKKRKFVGDVAFEEAAAVASMITPVPGGVGPMTIAMLLRNTVFAAERAAEQRNNA